LDPAWKPDPNEVEEEEAAGFQKKTEVFVETLARKVWVMICSVMLEA
jgi:hypothetical protein